MWRIGLVGAIRCPGTRRGLRYAVIVGAVGGQPTVVELCARVEGRGKHRRGTRAAPAALHGKRSGVGAGGGQPEGLCLTRQRQPLT